MLISRINQRPTRALDQSSNLGNICIFLIITLNIHNDSKFLKMIEKLKFYTGHMISKSHIYGATMSNRHCLHIRDLVQFHHWPK